MLGKLIKYDLKKMLKVLVYIYAITLAFAIFTRLVRIGDNIQFIAIIGYVLQGITISGICSILVNTFVHILLSITNGFYKDESYLTHTLPVKKNSLLLSKYISALIVVLISVATCLLGVVIMFYSKDVMLAIKTFIEISISNFNMSVEGFVVLICLLLLVQICYLITLMFAGVVLGNKYNVKRVIKGLLWVFAIYMATAVILLLSAILIFLIGGNIGALFAETLSQGQLITIIVLCIVEYSIFSIMLYFICNKLFNKGVNVD